MSVRILLLLGIVGLLLAGCGKKEKPKPKDEGPPPEKVEQVEEKKELDPKVIEKIENLIGSLKGEDDAINESAAEELLDMDETVLPYLVKGLDHKDMVIREHVTTVLVRMGAPAVGPLREALTGGTNNVQAQAAFALGELKEESAIDALAELLKHTELLVRMNAADALGKIGDPKPVSHLIGALKDPEQYMRTAAEEALEKITKYDFGSSYEKWKSWYDEEYGKK
jgi:HEAT repeat protein